MWREQTQFKTLLALGVGIILLVIGGCQSISSSNEQNHAMKMSAHSFEVLILSEKINTEVSILDRSARDFVYRGHEESREKFYILSSVLPNHYNLLIKMVSDDPIQLNRAISASKSAQSLTNNLEVIVSSYGDGKSHTIKDKMASFATIGVKTTYTQNLIEGLLVRENQLLSSRQNELESAQYSSIRSMAMFLIAGLVVILFAMRSVWIANITFAQKARLEERESRAAELSASEKRANEQARLLTALNKASTSLVSEHDLSTIVNDVVEYGVTITGAEFGAFFFLVENDGEKLLHLEALSGIPRDHFPDTNFLPATDLFVSHTSEILISHNVSQHPKFGLSPTGGFPKNHPQVKSYIGIPIISNAGVQIGALLFGHREEGRFTQIHTETVKGLAGITSIAIENAHLYLAAQTELAERTRAQNELMEATQRQNLLLQELNHRVKNTLVTVQSIAIQTKNAAISKLGLHNDPARLVNLNRFYSAFESRLLSLSGTHDLLVNGAWSNVLLCDALMTAVTPLIDIDRITIEGPNISLSPNVAVTISMVFHELLTNALKYGAGSTTEGTISIKWEIVHEKVLLHWKERGGPVVKNPDGVGFGSKLLERALHRELRGKSTVTFAPDGLECDMVIPLSNNITRAI